MVDDDKKQNKYVQTQQIGKGSFGSAFLVRNKEDGKQYVLKKVRLARQSSYQKNQNFQEVELLKTFKHPCLVPYVEHWVKEGHTICVVYGYCQNGDVLSHLQKLQKKGEHVEEPTAKLWLAQLLLGLWYLRQHHVLHRDIKSANLLLTGDNNLQIGDFGFATFRTGAENEDHGIIGTPHYMAPEMLMRKRYSFPADIWAAGVVAYELACNKPAFQAFNIEGLIHKIQRAGVPTITTFSEEYSSIVKSMLRKDPSRRPTALDVLRMPQLREAAEKALAIAAAFQPDAELPLLGVPTPITSSSHLPKRRPKSYREPAKYSGVRDAFAGEPRSMRRPPESKPPSRRKASVVPRLQIPSEALQASQPEFVTHEEPEMQHETDRRGRLRSGLSFDGVSAIHAQQIAMQMPMAQMQEVDAIGAQNMGDFLEYPAPAERTLPDDDWWHQLPQPMSSSRAPHALLAAREAHMYPHVPQHHYAHAPYVNMSGPLLGRFGEYGGRPHMPSPEVILEPQHPGVFRTISGGVLGQVGSSLNSYGSAEIIMVGRQAAQSASRGRAVAGYGEERKSSKVKGMLGRKGSVGVKNPDPGRSSAGTKNPVGSKQPLASSVTRAKSVLQAQRSLTTNSNSNWASKQGANPKHRSVSNSRTQAVYPPPTETKSQKMRSAYASSAKQIGFSNSTSMGRASSGSAAAPAAASSKLARPTQTSTRANARVTNELISLTRSSNTLNSSCRSRTAQKNRLTPEISPPPTRRQAKQTPPSRTPRTPSASRTPSQPRPVVVPTTSTKIPARPAQSRASPARAGPKPTITAPHHVRRASDHSNRNSPSIAPPTPAATSGKLPSRFARTPPPQTPPKKDPAEKAQAAIESTASYPAARKAATRSGQLASVASFRQVSPEVEVEAKLTPEQIAHVHELVDEHLLRASSLGEHVKMAGRGDERVDSGRVSRRRMMETWGEEMHTGQGASWVGHENAGMLTSWDAGLAPFHDSVSSQEDVRGRMVTPVPSPHQLSPILHHTRHHPTPHVVPDVGTDTCHPSWTAPSAVHPEPQSWTSRDPNGGNTPVAYLAKSFRGIREAKQRSIPASQPGTAAGGHTPSPKTFTGQRPVTHVPGMSAAFRPFARAGQAKVTSPFDGYWRSDRVPATAWQG